MLNKVNIGKITMGFLALLLFVGPQISYADWGVGVRIGDGGYRHDDRRFYRYHDHPQFGLHVHFLPQGYRSIWVGQVRYYYYDGLYYNYVGGDYVIVNPPEGAIVTAIPSDFQPVMINGVTYYANNGIYYVYTHHGYRVVERPVIVAQPTVVVQTRPMIPAPVQEDVFTVNVPNNNGGYASVVIRKSANGFVGPQGEFYAEFPKVSQLKVMYGR